MPRVYYPEIYFSLGQNANVFCPLQSTFGYKAKEEVMFGLGGAHNRSKLKLPRVIITNISVDAVGVRSCGGWMLVELDLHFQLWEREPG